MDKSDVKNPETVKRSRPSREWSRRNRVAAQQMGICYPDFLRHRTQYEAMDDDTRKIFANMSARYRQQRKQA